MIYVVAGNHDEYKEFCESRELNPYDNQKCCYVYGLPNLYGKIGIEVVLVGTFEYRLDWTRIYRHLVKQWRQIQVKRI